MNKKIRFAASALALVMAAGTAALPAAAAADEAQKDESVFVTLAPDGTAEKQTVSVWLHSDAGLAGFEDVSSLQNIRNLKGSETFSQQGERLVWDAAGTDIYYQGTTGRQLPVTAEIAYELDGESLTAEQLLGRSGHLKVTIRLTNHETHTILADGRTRTICTPFAALVGTNLDADHFAGVTAEHGTVQTDSANQLVGWACLPGMRQSLDGLLVGSLAGLQDKFFDEVSLEADVTDCPAISFMIACASDPDALSDLDETDELSELPGDIDELRDATDELLDGTAELLDGVIELHDAVRGDLADGVIKLDDSVSGELADGVIKMDNSVSGELTDGVKQLRDGLDTLTDNNDTLNAGADQIVAAVFASASQQINAQLGGAGMPSIKLTPDNYRAVLGGLSEQLSANAVQIAKNKIGASLDAALGSASLPAGVQQQTAKDILVYLAANYPYSSDLQANLAGAAYDLTNNLLPALSAGGQPGGGTAPAPMPFAAAGITPAPEAAPAPEGTAAPEAAPAPEETAAPETTPAPEETAAPETTPAPEETAAPETTPAPEETAAPETTPAPEETAAPETTPAPEGTAAPETTPAPEGAAAPETAPAQQETAGPDAAAAQSLAACGSRGVAAATALGSRSMAGGAQGMPVQLAASPAEIMGALQNPPSAEEIAAAWNTLAAAAVSGSSQAAQLQAVTAQLQAAAAQLDSVLQFQRGLAAYTEGVASAADGGQKLYDAVTGELASGTRELRDAVTGELASGTRELRDAVTGELGDGVNELLDGVRELVDGVTEYDEEGISKITGREEISQLNALLDTADALRDACGEYRSYSGAPEGISSTVKFVMRTRAPEAPEEDTPDETAAQPAAQPEHISFWQRLKNLFFGPKG